ncbi:MAG: pentapeptide repeat-containing protein [Candidatus Aminicenantes bacterium]|nr:pentapeptide repeat-containing protein [Candidatus Aminicenantes bacterium]
MNKISKIIKSIGQGIIKFLKLLWGMIERLAEKEVFLGLILLIIIGFFVIYLTLHAGNKYKDTFLNNIFIEAHGLVFDIFVFGVIVIIFDKIAERRRNIKRWKEGIDDFRGWDEKEAMYRIVGNIKRLNKEKVTEIDLNLCFLEKADLSWTDLRGGDLERANLIGANLIGADLRGAILIGADLSWTDLRGGNLEGAVLIGANLIGANLKEANLEEANLIGADLRGVKKLTIDQLSRVKTLFRVENLDPGFRAEVKEKYPQLFREAYVDILDKRRLRARDPAPRD